MDSRNISYYIEREQAVLARYNVHNYLANFMTSDMGVKTFAEMFYFVRVKFVRHNFMIGAKCPYKETYWRGIVGNLTEELGGKSSPSHNELYRRFLQSVGGAPESELQEPIFAQQFNWAWESYIQEHEVEESLYAIAIYEILDKPDYGMLLNVLSTIGKKNDSLAFFVVHAAAEHVSLFVDFLDETNLDHKRRKWEESAAEFVFSTQEKMWKGLITELRRVSR